LLFDIGYREEQLVIESTVIGHRDVDDQWPDDPIFNVLADIRYPITDAR
jgi:hypothetical protein